MKANAYYYFIAGAIWVMIGFYHASSGTGRLWIWFAGSPLLFARGAWIWWKTCNAWRSARSYVPDGPRQFNSAMLSRRTHIVGFAITSALFAICCAVMFGFGSQMKSREVIDPFVAVWSVNALVWVFFAVKVIRTPFFHAAASERKARLAHQGGSPGPRFLRKIVNLEKLGIEEVMLLNAASELTELHSRSRFDEMIEQVCLKYGFYGFPSREQNFDYYAHSFRLNEQYKRQVGYRIDGRMNADRSRLNKRCENLLLILSGLCGNKLSDPDGRIYHDGMSAPEQACFQLASYGLLRPARGGGFWTPAGEEALRFALSDQFEPLSEFTFEDVA